MRTRGALGLGSITGLLVTAVYWDFAGDEVMWAAVCVLGALLGAIAGGYVHAANRWPRRVTALLVALSPALGLIGATVGLPQLIELAALLALPLVATLFCNASARAALRLNPLTAMLVAYAVATIPSAMIYGHAGTALSNVAPLALFFVGMLLQAGPPGAAAGEERAKLLRLLAPAILCGAILLAVLALTLPITGAAATQAALALGAMALLAISWDARRFFWRVVLGAYQRSVRFGAATVGISFLCVAGVVLARRATPGIVLALVLALMVVAILRKRFSEIALVVISCLPLMSGYGLEWLRDPIGSLSAGFDTEAWGRALNLGVSTPFGAGFEGAGMYQRTLATTGVSGVAALVLTLVLALGLCARTYTRLRPSSGEAGSILAAGGLCIFIAVAGIFADPLGSPALAMALWLFLGMANGTIEAVQQVTSPRPSAEEQRQFARLRGYPLRVAYVLEGDAKGEAALAFSDYLHTLDRTRVEPLLLAVGTGSLISLARGMGVETQIVKEKARPRKAAAGGSWLRRSPPARLVRWVRRELSVRRWTLRRTALMVRAALALEPDLLVSLDPTLHLVTLVTGRSVGVPVQWHARDVATARAQHALNTLAPWAVGVLASSQTVARTYNVRRPGMHVRVLRPSIVIESTPVAGRDEVRQRLGIPLDARLLAIVKPITATSGHQDVIDALPSLLAATPNLRLVIFEEAPPQALLDEEHSVTARIRANATEAKSETTLRTTRLRNAIASGGFAGVAKMLAPRADALEILAASDVAIFPQERATGSRDLLLALAAGVPIVATGNGAHVELLTDAWGYLLVKPHDAREIATSVGVILQQMELYRANARRNRALVRDWFSAQVECGRVLRIYGEICQPSGQRLRLPTKREIVPLRRHWLTALWEAQGAE